MVSRIGSLLIAVSLLAVLIVSGAGAEMGAAPLQNGVLGITHGAHIRPVYLEQPPDSLGPEDYGYGKEILNFNNLVQKDVGLVMWFDNWNQEGTRAWDPFLLILINYEITDPSKRPVIMLTWVPSRQIGGSFGCTKSYGDGSYPPEWIPPQDIIDGVCDAYLQIFRDDIKAHPDQRFILRFAHEMNIREYDYWPGNHANPETDGDPNLYIAMYQHVYDVIMDEPGAPTNLEWIWSPNYASNPDPSVPGYEWNEIFNYYPGDDYVDWIGLSGYNWYDTPGQNNPWRDFSYLYDEVLTDLTCRYAKPQIIAEIGSIEGNGTTLSKADWITDAYQRARQYPFLRSIVWFNDYAYENPSSADFRVTTGSAQAGTPDSVDPLPSTGNPAWTDAYAAALDDPIYTSTLPSLAAATPAHPICGQLYLPLIQR